MFEVSYSPLHKPLVAIRKVDQSLGYNGFFEATARRSLVSSVARVSFPKLGITPLDREEDGEYRCSRGRREALDAISVTYVSIK